jgi:FKBP-type peptidyl-prolyl cis-trans isomerase FklB
MTRHKPLLLLLSFVSQTHAGTNAVGKQFLEENKGKDGVVTLPSGMQYKVVRAGAGTDHPTADSSCECHYEGRTAQEFSKEPKGTKFDSSYDRGSPTSFAPNQVIKGWTEAMQLMVEGDKWELYIPSELGYGDRGSGANIGGGDVLVFTIEIIKINGGKVPAVKCNVKTLEKCDEKQSKYVTGKKSLDAAALEQEMKRLVGMKGKKMAPAQEGWLNVRMRLLQSLKDEL